VRLVKMLGLAAIAALAAMALTGASSASAAQIDKCLLPSAQGLMNLTKAECEAKSGTIDTISTLTAKATNPALTGFLKQTCDESKTKVKTEGTAEGAKATVEELSFTGNCKPCSTVTVNSLPYVGKVTMVGSEYFLESKGDATLSGCPLGVKCRFSTENAKLKLVLGKELVGNEFRAENVELKLVEGSKSFCGSTGTWNANYVTLPTDPPYFLFLL
jgi:hypothetical protein